MLLIWLSLLPCLLWLAFFYVQDWYQREPLWLIGVTFLLGAASALVALRVKPYYLHHPDLAPGTAKWVDYSPQVAVLVFPPPRITLAAVVRVSKPAPVSATSGVLSSPFCSVVPTLEVFDSSSNKTTVVLSGPVLTPPILLAPRRATSPWTALSQDSEE